MRRSRRLAHLAAALILLAGTTAYPWGRKKKEAPKKEPAGEKVKPPEAWFQEIKRPVVLDPDTTAELCRELLRGIRKNTFPDFVTALAPAAGDGPRAVFLACSDGKTRARVEFGVGTSLSRAVGDAFRKISANKPLRQARWLKLDIVQNAIALGGFVTRESPIPFPSLVGLAFGPLSGIAFSPEQLIGWNLVDAKQRLAIHRINNYFLKLDDWKIAGRWLRVSSFQQGQRVVFFETQSYFTAGDEVIPLYRGHRLYDTVTSADLLAAAAGAADRLAAAVGKDGVIHMETPGWIAKLDGINEPLQSIKAARAMLAAYKATRNQTYLRCARRLAERLAHTITPYGADRRRACIVQNEYRDLDPNRIEEPRPIVCLDTNALAICLFIDIDALVDGTPFRKRITLLARHLLAQVQPGGDFVVERSYPSMRLIPRADPTSNALAALALVRLYETYMRPGFLAAAGKAIDNLLAARVEKRSMGDLPRDQALMAALDAYFTFDRQDRIVLQVQRLALAAVADQDREPDFPDLFGSVVSMPSATIAAERTLLTITAARILRDARRGEAANELLGEVWPGVLFQLQARIRPPTAMYQEKPGQCLDLFRDHLRRFGFDLRGQAAQIASLLAVRAELERATLEALPRPKAIAEKLASSRALCNRFPRVLSPALALPPVTGPGGTTAPKPKSSYGPVIRPVPKPGTRNRRHRKRRAYPRVIPVRPVPKR